LSSSPVAVLVELGEERSNNPSLNVSDHGSYISTEQESAYLLEIQFTVQNVR